MTRPAGVLVEPYEEGVCVDRLLVALSALPESAVLESSRPDDAYGRFSIFGVDPVEVVQLSLPARCDPWRRLSECLHGPPVVLERSDIGPFAWGWIGWIAYETGLYTESIRPRACPRRRSLGARFALFDTFAVRDHASNAWSLVAVDWPSGTFDQRPQAGERIRALRTVLKSAGDADLPQPREPRASPAEPNLSYPDYLARVNRAKRYIEAGDVYQVNLAQRFTVRTSATPVELYQRLRRISPSTHGALIVRPGEAIVSSSPELFWDLRGQRVVTRPIKGTRPRSDDPVVDGSLRTALAESEKDRAELTMIVDLLRNDLGRVCRFGSVRVVEPARIETHPTVFHQVATIEGELRSECSWLDLMRSTFPGGSITGAPKIRAMQIIDELEPAPRGVYCGSIGWIGLGGDASFNIAIRTLIQRDRRVDFHAGGAIVADSRGEDEYEETLAKASAMFKALNTDLSGRRVCAKQAAFPR